MTSKSLETRMQKIEEQLKQLASSVADLDRRLGKANRAQQRTLLAGLHEHLGLVVFDNGGGGAHAPMPSAVAAKLQSAIDEGKLKK